MKILKLDNNNLQAIGNIENLTQLVHLDMSFNKLKNLNFIDGKKFKMPKLKILSFYSNCMSDINGISEFAPNLNILSLGSNLFSQYDQLKHIEPI